ncbi:MAG: hypothetical protein JNK37_24920 [Verrucomicrobiales bacterium]|nr:hypothetical protein [Verrucomicrobiales bacterium]
MKHPDNAYEELIALAREHRTGSDADFGFETRLLARIRQARAESEGVVDLFGRWLWGTAWGLTPVLTVTLLAVGLLHGFSLPAGAESVVTQLSDWLPVTLP